MGQERQSKERVQPQGDALLVANGCEICVKRYKMSISLVFLENFSFYMRWDSSGYHFSRIILSFSRYSRSFIINLGLLNNVIIKRKCCKIEGMSGDIDAQLAELDQKIAQIIDPVNLKTQLAGSNTINFSDLSKLQQRDHEIVQELQQLRELWVVSTLFKEIEVNLELYEFENVFYSLKNFIKKIKSDTFGSNLIIIGKLQDEHDRYYEQAIEQIKESWSKLIVIDNDYITFNAEVEINGNVVLFETIADVIKANNLQTQIPNSNITHLIDQSLLTALVNSKLLDLVDNKISIIDSKPTIQDQIKSVSNLANFISFIPDDQQIINYISSRLFEWLKEVTTVNIEQVYSDKSLQNEFLQLSDLLSSKNFKRNDLQNWIKNELNEIAIENYLDLHFDQVRDLIRSVDKSVFQNLITKEYKEASPSEPEPIQQPQVAEPTVSEEEDDDDGWGWNDEDVDLEESNEKVEKDQDDWDWNDDEDEEEQPKPKKKLVSKLAKKQKSNENSRDTTPIPATTTKQHYQVTKIPDEVNKIIKSYISTQSKLPEQYHDLHYSKLNYLVTGFYILISQEFQKSSKNALLLYNDLTYLSQLTNIPRLVEIKEQYLTNYIKSFENDIDEHYNKLSGLDPSISSSETFEIIDNIQLIFTMFFKKINSLPPLKYNELVSALVESFYIKIIASVFDKYDIGEAESEYLNIILHKFLQLKFPIEHSKIKHHSKLSHIAFIISSHLKDIMESFYNAEFYDLSTEQLIALIDKLFADSDLKRRSIEDIREIREAE